MKTIEINLYSFNELSEEAKEKALENWRYEQEYFWADDSIESLKKFAEHFNAELTNYGIDFFGCSHSHAKFNVPDEEFTENELKSLIESMGTYNSETLRGNGDCKFTGVCFDEDAADGARRAFFNGERDLNSILQAGFATWLKDVQADAEYQQSEEYFAEHCEGNDYTFEADGTMNNG